VRIIAISFKRLLVRIWCSLCHQDDIWCCPTRCLPNCLSLCLPSLEQDKYHHRKRLKWERDIKKTRRAVEITAIDAYFLYLFIDFHLVRGAQQYIRFLHWIGRQNLPANTYIKQSKHTSKEILLYLPPLYFFQYPLFCNLLTMWVIISLFHSWLLVTCESTIFFIGNPIVIFFCRMATQ
jgi:hypothetical protein